MLGTNVTKKNTAVESVHRYRRECCGI